MSHWAWGLVAVLGACGKAEVKPIAADGSSTVFLMSEAASEAFHSTAPDVRVMIAVSSTSDGFKGFCAGHSDFSDASRPIRSSEIDLCKEGQVEFVELPVAYDGIAVVVNPKNDWATDITRAELKKLWEPAADKTITRWSQVRDGWPDRPIALFGPAMESGSYDYFTEAIVGKEHSSRADFTASADDNVVVNGVAADPGALGWFGCAYYEENRERLRLLPIDAGKGPIAPSPTTIADGSYSLLSRPLFVYVKRSALDRAEVARFFELYLDKAPMLAPEVGFVPLSARAYELARARLDKRIVGSLFDGKGTQVGATLSDLLARQAAP